MNVFKALLFFIFSCGIFCSCKVTGQVSQRSVDAFLNDTAVRTGHAGISIYDPSSKKYLYNYNAEKNFLPSSNVKLFTLYAGMKYLGDSIVAAEIFEASDTLYFHPTGDPTFLHKDFLQQPFLKYLTANRKKLVLALSTVDNFKRYGAGWAWDDMEEDFMPERNRFPLYGNVFTFFEKDNLLSSIPPPSTTSKYFGEMNRTYNGFFKVTRSSFDFDTQFYFIRSNKKFEIQQIPFPTERLYHDQFLLLADTLKIDEHSIAFLPTGNKPWKKIYSRPVDSLFRPMMFNSDNFFAEQTLLMVSNEKLGHMSDDEIIDTLLKTDFKDIPTKPRWVDGSGLSRYDLFSPKDFIYILNKLQSDFGLARMKRILPTGGQGTLTNYYESDAGFIYAKTGSMSNNVSLSGYLITKKNKTLIFSVIINNFEGTGKSGRRAIEKLLKEVRSSN
jgi:D-alanyl-D-alanine carboxypeptidase/D-alanyl-D-alanine-endopeptidase (penicillin-binding protein 4)